MEKEVIVRFAPSPTGYLHIGGARTALFNYLYARNKKGKFLLRIEDTDVQRSTEESIQQIIDALHWLGIEWDGEIIYQSKRLELYNQKINQLIEENKAYYCFCSNERLEKLRAEALEKGVINVYDGKCRNLNKKELEEKFKTNPNPVVRFKVREGKTIVQDLIKGEVVFDNETIDDFIIRRSDNWPTYNLCCVIDDIDMGITVVIRGDDHLSNTPKQILISQALGVELPVFAHLPLILGPDKTRLSKRHGATSVLQFKEEGFHPEALVNFLALLGWSPANDQEIFPKGELIKEFSVERVSKTAAVFDYEKLRWFNGQYMKLLDKNLVIERVMPFLKQSGYNIEQYPQQILEYMIGLMIERARTLKDLVENLHYFFVEQVEYEEKAISKYLSKRENAELLENIYKCLSEQGDFSTKALEEVLRGLADKLKISFTKIVHPLRASITGKLESPGIFDVLYCLGKERSLKRIRTAIEFVTSK